MEGRLEDVRQADEVPGCSARRPTRAGRRRPPAAGPCSRRGRPAASRTTPSPLNTVDRLAVELELDAVDRRELGQRVHDLGKAAEDRRRSPTRLELAGQVDGGDPALDRRPRKRVPSGMAVYIAGRAPSSPSFGPARSAFIGGRTDGLRRRDLAQHRGQAGVVDEAAEEEVGADDRRSRGRAAASCCRPASGSAPAVGRLERRGRRLRGARRGLGRRELEGGLLAGPAGRRCRGRPSPTRTRRGGTEGWQEPGSRARGSWIGPRWLVGRRVGARSVRQPRTRPCPGRRRR